MNFDWLFEFGRTLGPDCLFMAIVLSALYLGGFGFFAVRAFSKGLVVWRDTYTETVRQRDKFEEGYFRLLEIDREKGRLAASALRKLEESA